MVNFMAPLGAIRTQRVKFFLEFKKSIQLKIFKESPRKNLKTVLDSDNVIGDQIIINFCDFYHFNSLNCRTDNPNLKWFSDLNSAWLN
jgi:hypothetical protein